MSRNSVPSPKVYKNEELKELLANAMRGSAFSVDSYLVDNKVACRGKYYDYYLTSSGNEIVIKPKWNQMWFLGVLVCGILGIFFFVPFIGVAVIGLIGNSEYSEFKRILKDSLYNGDDTQYNGNNKQSYASIQNANASFIECPKCKGKYENSSNFCPICGEPKPKEPVKKRCAKCNAELEANTLFCPHCGEKVQEENEKTERICKNCGTLLKDDTVFCGNCGTKVGD